MPLGKCLGLSELHLFNTVGLLEGLGEIVSVFRAVPGTSEESVAITVDLRVGG